MDATIPPAPRGRLAPAAVQVLYEAAAFLLFTVVAGKYFLRAEQFTAYVVGSAGVMGFAWIGRAPRLRHWSVALGIFALASFAFADSGMRGGWSYLPGIFLLAGEQQFARRRGRARGISCGSCETTFISLAALCGWMWTTSRLNHSALGDFKLVAGWSLYGGALFALGVVSRERVCRWWGLGVLASALGHVGLVDIWLLGNFERFLCLLVLSLVLLGIGFFYNRFPSKLRGWL